jgi:hypothetical protein
MSAADITVIGILVIAVIAAVSFIRKQQKCGGSCAGCPLAGECKKKEKEPGE